jgi:hypothetical protein
MGNVVLKISTNDIFKNVNDAEYYTKLLVGKLILLAEENVLMAVSERVNYV